MKAEQANSALHPTTSLAARAAVPRACCAGRGLPPRSPGGTLARGRTCDPACSLRAQYRSLSFFGAIGEAGALSPLSVVPPFMNAPAMRRKAAGKSSAGAESASSVAT